MVRNGEDGADAAAARDLGNRFLARHVHAMRLELLRQDSYIIIPSPVFASHHSSFPLTISTHFCW
jgi:hypothetical protein